LFWEELDMFVATLVFTILLAVAFAFAGGSKLAGVQQMRDSATHLGFSFPAYQRIGALEVLGAAGLLIGLWFAPLGIAAAAGLVLLTIGAVYFHIKAKDPAKIYAFPVVFVVFSLVALVLRAVTA
jgi:uncharacterized membrane protein YphA (DoxX/SURF4 family)